MSCCYQCTRQRDIFAHRRARAGETTTVLQQGAPDEKTLAVRLNLMKPAYRLTGHPKTIDQRGQQCRMEQSQAGTRKLLQGGSTQRRKPGSARVLQQRT